ncbi:MAG: hypothetical protein KGL39_43310, partial [Patescibacteria group bacterium]|nr:hypothetical protein [Patescibacteria group bacterium]
MPEYLSTIGVACRACGAVRAPMSASDNAGLEWKVCANCWMKFTRWYDGEPGAATEDDFNGWLARYLFLELRRREKTGVSGRCQAISDSLYG